MYLIYVNGLAFCEPVDRECKDYILLRLQLFPDLRVKVVGVEVRTA